MNSGTICIDHRDILSYSLADLRGNQNIVLQHPFIIQTETIRFNLDPDSKISDSHLMDILRQAALEGNEAEPVSLDQKATGLS